MKRITLILLLVGGFFALMLTLSQSLYAAKLEVLTIPQEDELRQKGLMILCPSGFVPGPPAPDPCILPNIFPFVELASQVRDLHAEYKIHFALDGVNRDPDTLTCIVVQKDVCHIGVSGKRPVPRQFPAEIEGTDAIDVSTQFKCKYRRSEKPGVGVLDVYFLSDNPKTDDPAKAPSPLFIGDHILKVEAEVSGDFASEIQDLCILGAPNCRFFGGGNLCVGELLGQTVVPNDFVFSVLWPDGAVMIKFADPIFPFASCKNAALFQREKFYGPFVQVGFCTSPFIKGVQDP